MNAPLIVALPPQHAQAVANMDGGFIPRALLSGAIAAASVHLQSASEHIATGNAAGLVASMRLVMSCTKMALETLPGAIEQIRDEGTEQAWRAEQ